MSLSKTFRQHLFVAHIAVLLCTGHGDAAPLKTYDLASLEPKPPARIAKIPATHVRPAARLTSYSRPTMVSRGAGDNSAKAKDVYERGNFAMQAGQNAEAIAAFEQALRLDPGFNDAWGKLAFLYLKEGKSARAIEAFKKAKQLGDANGGLVTRNASGGLQFP